MSLQQLDLNPKIIHALKRARLHTLKSVLHQSPSEVQKSTGLSTKEVSILFDAVATNVCSLQPLTVLQLKEEKPPLFLSTGCQVLDAFLKGGVRLHCITEIAGESSAGKTQVGLQLAITCQLPVDLGGQEEGAVYVCTEDAFPHRRLAQMLQLLQSRNMDPRITKKSFMDSIFIQHVNDLDELRSVIMQRLPQLLSRRQMSLVVIDSIAALFRTEFTRNQMSSRAQLLSAFGSQLRKLATDHNLAVVCINQVSDLFAEREPKQTKVVPALGLAWASMVTTRLMLSRSSQHMVYSSKTSSSSYEVNVRNMEVLFSPYLPNTICRYVIDEEGVKGLA